MAKLMWVILIAWQVGTISFVYGESSHDDDVPVYGRPKPAGKPRDNDSGRCGVRPQPLADFANGGPYNYGSLVTFVTSTDCLEAGRNIAASAISQGINWSKTPPYNLQAYANSVTPSDLESLKKTDVTLGKIMPGVFRENPLSTRELLPITGQLALLSPTAARAALVNIISQELYTADSQMLNESAKRGKGSSAATATELARTLVKLGANESSIANEMAENVEEMAVLAQADSLAKIFRALGKATQNEPSLVNVFNLSAGAMNRGVQKANKIYQADQKSNLLKTVFTAVQSAIFGSEQLEAGAIDLNDALATLMGGYPLQKTSLKTFWREAMKVLIQTPTQVALAQALSLSLTPDIVFLKAEDAHMLVAAARNYPGLAAALQSNFLIAYTTIWESVMGAQMRPKQFNEMKARYFAPLVAEILELGPVLIDHRWLKEVWRRGLISDTDIEKRFPKFMLALIERREKNIRQAAKNVDFENTVGIMAENFAMLWVASSVEVPALNKWVSKFEE